MTNGVAYEKSRKAFRSTSLLGEAYGAVSRQPLFLVFRARLRFPRWGLLGGDDPDGCDHEIEDASLSIEEADSRRASSVGLPCVTENACSEFAYRVDDSSSACQKVRSDTVLLHHDVTISVRIGAGKWGLRARILGTLALSRAEDRCPFCVIGVCDRAGDASVAGWFGNSDVRQAGFRAAESTSKLWFGSLFATGTVTGPHGASA